MSWPSSWNGSQSQIALQETPHITSKYEAGKAASGGPLLISICCVLSSYGLHCHVCHRQERAQQILQAKYRRIVADFGAGTAEIQSALDQVHRCFELLRADSPPAQPPPRLTSAPADEEDWEDVDADKGGPFCMELRPAHVSVNYVA